MEKGLHMFIRQSSYLKPALLFIMILVFVGCSATKLYKKGDHKKSKIVGAVIQDQETSVEIREEVDGNGNVIMKGFNHPYYFAEEGLSNILSSIYYKEKGMLRGSGRRKLFRSEELQKIVPAIINAFSMATDSQDILVFSTSHKVLLSDRQSYFSMFIVENELNIAFSTINSKKSLNERKSYRLGNKSKLKDPLTVKKGTIGMLSYWSLVPMGGQRLRKGYDTWLIVDMTNDLYGLASADDTDSGLTPASGSMKGIQQRVAADSNFANEKKKYQNVREKLRELKSLKDDGLISEEDYDEKKQELLNQF